MYFSLNWIKEYATIGKITPKELGERLTLSSFEIESINNKKEKFEGVVIGKVLEVKKHPNADKLRLAKVNSGDKTLSIVCGASNLEAGQTVPVALIGTTLPNGLTLEAREIRGEKSQGMICAEDELGL